MEKFKCLVLMPQGSKTGSAGIIFDDRNPNDCNDVVFMSTAAYHNLFGLKTAKHSNYWRGNIVKITFGKHSIHRRVLIEHLAKEELALTYESIGELTYYDETTAKPIRPIAEQVEITKGCHFMYWWKHPNPAARISFVLGVTSIALAIVGLVLAIAQLCF